MKNSATLKIGQPLLLPPVEFAHRIAIVSKDSPPSWPYVECIEIFISKRGGSLQSVSTQATYYKEKVELLVSEGERDENLLMCEIEK
jgi:hypothetical protein